MKEWVTSKFLLALIQSEQLYGADGKSAIAKQRLVVSFGQEVHLSENHALNGRYGHFSAKRLERRVPVILEELWVLVGPRLGGS